MLMDHPIFLRAGDRKENKNNNEKSSTKVKELLSEFYLFSFSNKYSNLPLRMKKFYLFHFWHIHNHSNC